MEEKKGNLQTTFETRGLIYLREKLSLIYRGNTLKEILKSNWRTVKIYYKEDVMTVPVHSLLGRELLHLEMMNQKGVQGVLYVYIHVAKQWRPNLAKSGKKYMHRGKRLWLSDQEFLHLINKKGGAVITKTGYT